ncbi:MAG: hypothetical protein JSS91_08155 [Bacteroidetes bacterium]|nr:hypothetical protein [Bacteroidota bacterium]
MRIIFSAVFFFILFIISKPSDSFSQNFRKEPQKDIQSDTVGFKSPDSVIVKVKEIDSVSVVKKKMYSIKKDSLINKEKHPQDNKGKGGFYFVSGNKKSDYRILGSIRIFGSYDINGLRGGTSFSLSDIPVGDSRNTENTFFMTANISRIGIETNHYTSIGKIFMKLESDFNGSSSLFRIRHAFGQSENFLAGQTWTVFSDVESLPNTVDLEGPPTAVSLRTVQIRYYKDFKNKFYFKASFEAPRVSINVPDSLNLEPVSQKFPDVAVSLRKKFKGFDISAAGVLKSITVRDLTGELGSLTGWGGLLSGKFKLFSNFSFSYQGVIGSGISSYLNISDNNTNDVLLNTQDGKYELTESLGGYVSLSRKLLRGLIDLNIVYGQLSYKMKDYFSDDAFEFGQYFAFNAFLITKEEFKLGFEYTYGFKRTKSKQSANANRLAFTFYYDF